MAGGAAERVFAHEFNAARAGDQDGVVLTLLRVRCSRVFIVGVLTEVNGSAGGPVQLRIADPTGTFLVRIPSREEALAETAAAIAVPSFVAVTGSCHCSQKPPRCSPYIIPETIVPSDREARDAWIARTAARALDRIERIRSVPEKPAAAGHMQTSAVMTGKDPLLAMAEVVLGALDVLKKGAAGSSAPPSRKDPKDVILRFIATPRDPAVVPLGEILAHGRAHGFSEEEVRTALEALLEEGECYMPRNGLIKMA